MSFKTIASRSRERIPSIRPMAAGLLFMALVFPAGSATAQEPGTVSTVFSGYGVAGYNSTVGEGRNDFSGQLALKPLTRVGEDLLLGGELKAELEGDSTNIILEHMEISYQGFERFQFTAGKFHLPIGVWSHANWTNKLPTEPLLYEDTHGEATEDALMPIPFDTGVKGVYTMPSPSGWRNSASFWVSQGPTGTFGGGHTHGEEEEAGHDEGPQSDAPLLQLGSNYQDNNSDKMLGLSLRSSSMAGLTLQGSAFHAAYDDAGDQSLSGVNLGVVWSPRSLFEFRGEATLMRQEYVDHHDAGQILDLEGYYLQLSKRMGSWEPVARASYLPEVIAGHATHIEQRRQLAVGINYWLSPSAPVKLAYNWEADRADGVFLEWTVGF